ncbi:MAG: sulfotransferase domain-containing protein [Nocardiopsaceae bacterium]|nr:sulfotransferase domain-containing protein [Nocardiopsaceae bacterium]
MSTGPGRRPLPGSLKQAICSASEAFGQATRELRSLPTFLIAGGQRCGTTSLFTALTQHPQITGPTLHKGVHYFDTGYAHGLDWYRGHFPVRSATRPRDGRPRIEVCESSPYYLFHPLCAQRIAHDLPEIKVIVMLRDPVDRAHSAHSHEYAQGYETEPFERALELEEERLRGEEERLRTDPDAHSYAHQHHAYLARGRYVDQLQRLEKHLGRDRLHIVESEDFCTDPAAVFSDIESFLGIAHHKEIRFGRHNTQHRADLSPDLRARLNAHFTDHDQRLADWLGRPPAWRV